MAHPPPYPDSGDDVDEGPDRRRTTNTSRWVYVYWIVGIGLVLLVVVLHLTGVIGPGGH
jgi:hypothetical protein